MERIITILRGHYGRPAARPGGDPLDHLIATILSQNTSDTNTSRSFAALRRRFASWAEARDAPVEEIADAIRAGGLAEQKAPRIKQALEIASAASGEPDMGFLRDMPSDQARAWLRSIPGVGPKTASCVLLFALGRDVFPVDTHVERIAKRLGIVPATATPEAAGQALEALTPTGQCLEGHLLLIQHGRTLCRARSPLCGACPLRAMCAFENGAGLGAKGEVGHTEPGNA